MEINISNPQTSSCQLEIENSLYNQQQSEHHESVPTTPTLQLKV